MNDHPITPAPSCPCGAQSNARGGTQDNIPGGAKSGASDSAQDGSLFSEESAGARTTTRASVACGYDSRGRLISVLQTEGDFRRQVRFTYNEAGLRTCKQADNMIYRFARKDGRLLCITAVDLYEGYPYHAKLLPLYEGEEPVGILYHTYDLSGGRTVWTDTRYDFIKDSQKSVIGLLAPNRTHVVGYGYDARGGCTLLFDRSVHGIGAANPFRYKSRYYDTETGWYYHDGHYYDPATGVDPTGALARPERP